MKIGAVMFFTTESMQPAELGRALEQRGFESLWVPEHSHIPLVRTKAFPGGPELPRPYYDIMDPFLVLTAAAVATKTLKVGTGVCLINQRDPIRPRSLSPRSTSFPADVSCSASATAGTARRWNTTAPIFPPGTSCHASVSRRCGRSGRRTPRSIMASSSTSRRCRPGRSQCRSRIRR